MTLDAEAKMTSKGEKPGPVKIGLDCLPLTLSSRDRASRSVRPSAAADDVSADNSVVAALGQLG